MEEIEASGRERKVAKERVSMSGLEGKDKRDRAGRLTFKDGVVPANASEPLKVGVRGVDGGLASYGDGGDLRIRGEAARGSGLF